jgi:hypothetical protein
MVIESSVLKKRAFAGKQHSWQASRRPHMIKKRFSAISSQFQSFLTKKTKIVLNSFFKFAYLDTVEQKYLVFNAAFLALMLFSVLN